MHTFLVSYTSEWLCTIFEENKLFRSKRLALVSNLDLKIVKTFFLEGGMSYHSRLRVVFLTEKFLVKSLSNLRLVVGTIYCIISLKKNRNFEKKFAIWKWIILSVQNVSSDNVDSILRKQSVFQLLSRLFCLQHKNTQKLRHYAIPLTIGSFNFL